jgi:hypothetical protein
MAAEPVLAPSNTLLNYSIRPTHADYGTTVTFTFIALNNGPQDITFTPDDEIVLVMPVGNTESDLLVNSDVTAASLSWGFVFVKLSGEPGEFRVGVVAPRTITSGMSLVFQVSGAQINTTSTKGLQPTAISVPVNETIGSSINTDYVVVTKTPPELAVSCVASPTAVGLNQPTSISWKAASASYVILVPGHQRQSCSGIYSLGIFKNVVASQVPITPFQVTAYTDDQQQVHSIPVNVETVQPTIDFGPQNLPPIGYEDTVTLQWTTKYATAVYLSPGQSDPVEPVDSLTIKPSSYALPNASSVTFTLTAHGYLGPVNKTVTIYFQPVRILSFGYPSWPPTDRPPVAVVQNGLQQIQVVGVKPTIYQLTATGVGGPLTRYIGPGRWLEIMYFGATPNPVAPGELCKILCVTLNADSRTFEVAETAALATPIGSPVTIDPWCSIQRTEEFPFWPMRNTVCTLTATGLGSTISSQITIMVSR